MYAHVINKCNQETDSLLVQPRARHVVFASWLIYYNGEKISPQYISEMALHSLLGMLRIHQRRLSGDQTVST